MRNKRAESMITAQLKHRWLELFDISKRKIAENLFTHIQRQYSEPHRAYRTITHINACLEQLDEVIDDIEDAYAFELALWFHDIVYQPAQNDNEARSADDAQTDSILRKRKHLLH